MGCLMEGLVRVSQRVVPTLSRRFEVLPSVAHVLKTEAHANTILQLLDRFESKRSHGGKHAANEGGQRRGGVFWRRLSRLQSET